MGYRSGRIVIDTRISGNDPERTAREERLHEEIVARVKLILEDPKYADISPWVIDEGP